MNILKYISGFFRSLFTQLFKKDGVKIVESENVAKVLQKPMSFKEYKALRKKLVRYFTKPCGYCGQDMIIGRGQIAFWHRRCRTRGRNANA